MRPGYGKMNSQNVLGRLLLLCAFGAMTCQSASADLVQEPWEVICVVSNASTQSSRTFIRNENPFQNSHTATLGNSSCSASYDFAWTGDEARFDIYPSHHLEQLRGDTSSSGRILIWPAVDSIVTFSGNWQYAWPGTALGTTNLYMSVIGPDGTLAENIAHGGNVGLGPPFGTFELSNNARLEVGNAYLLNYIVRIQHFDPTPPGTFGHGEGSLNFTITPVPEPATLALLVLSISIFKPRRRDHVAPHGVNAVALRRWRSCSSLRNS